MHILTWLTPTGETYVSSMAQSSADCAIADRPASMPQARYERENGQWEQVYDEPKPEDISIGEAEELWVRAAEGDVLAAVLLKVAGL